MTTARRRAARKLNAAFEVAPMPKRKARLPGQGAPVRASKAPRTHARTVANPLPPVTPQGTGKRGRVVPKRATTPLARNFFSCEWAALRVEVMLPVRTKSEMNCRDHWRVVSKRKREHHAITAASFSQLPHNTLSWIRGAITRPLRITMTRLGPRPIDSDGAISGAKFCRDEIARILGIDDGDDGAATWEYAREIAGVYGVRVRIESATSANAGREGAEGQAGR